MISYYMFGEDTIMYKNENVVTFEEDELKTHNLLQPRPCLFQPLGRLVSPLDRHFAWYIKGGQSRDRVSTRSLILKNILISISIRPKPFNH